MNKTKAAEALKSLEVQLKGGPGSGPRPGRGRAGAIERAIGPAPDDPVGEALHGSHVPKSLGEALSISKHLTARHAEQQKNYEKSKKEAERSRKDAAALDSKAKQHGESTPLGMLYKAKADFSRVSADQREAEATLAKVAMDHQTHSSRIQFLQAVLKHVGPDAKVEFLPDNAGFKVNGEEHLVTNAAQWEPWKS